MTNTSVVVYTAGNSAPSSQGKVAVDTPVATEILTKAGSVNLSVAKHIFLGSGYKLLCTNKDDLRLLTHIITGHSYLKFFQHKIGNERSPLCDKCGEDTETVAHYLTQCPAFALQRYQHFGAFQLNGVNIRLLAIVKNLLSFCKSTRYLEFYGTDQPE